MTPATVTTRELPRSAWRAYFDALSARRTGGRRLDYAELRLLSLEDGVQPETGWLPFYGITYEPEAGTLEVLVEGLDRLIYHPHTVFVAEQDGVVVGCGALHVMWEDLAEIRTLAVRPEAKGHGVGSLLMEALVADARDLGVERLFCLTFEVDFFTRHGFVVIEGQAVEPEVYAELVRSYDEGVAEFLDLERVKPNTLGNTRMLAVLGC